MIARRSGSWLWLLLAVVLSASWASNVQAQERKPVVTRKAQPKKVARKREAKSEAAATSSNAANVAPAAASASEGKAPASPPSAAKPVRVSDAEEDVRKEAGGDVKVLEFTGLDIEGNLKTPQMLYFLNRLRAEFGRPRLPHRSFMPELQRSTKEKSF